MNEAASTVNSRQDRVDFRKGPKVLPFKTNTLRITCCFA